MRPMRGVLRLITSAVASVDSIGRRADAYRQVGSSNCAGKRSTMKKEGFSYEYHYKTKDGLALADFKINACE